jgi:hypothetical protein
MGFEAIAYVLALDAGCSDKQAAREPHVDRLGRIASGVPEALMPHLDSWPQRSADAYNGVKHANRDLPDQLTMANVQRENCLVFRLWIARNIGVPTEVLARNLRTDRLARPYTTD